MKELNVYNDTNQMIFNNDVKKEVSVLRELLHNAVYANMNIAGQIRNDWQFNNHTITCLLKSNQYDTNHRFTKLFRQIMVKDGFFDTDLFIKDIQNQICTQRALNENVPTQSLKYLQQQAKAVLGKWLYKKGNHVQDVSIFNVKNLLEKCIKALSRA